MKISKEELEKRLARQSEIFSDYLFLARKMAKHDFTVFYHYQEGTGKSGSYGMWNHPRGHVWNVFVRPASS